MRRLPLILLVLFVGCKGQELMFSEIDNSPRINPSRTSADQSDEDGVVDRDAVSITPGRLDGLGDESNAKKAIKYSVRIQRVGDAEIASEDIKIVEGRLVCDDGELDLKNEEMSIITNTDGCHVELIMLSIDDVEFGRLKSTREYVGETSGAVFMTDQVGLIVVRKNLHFESVAEPAIVVHLALKVEPEQSNLPESKFIPSFALRDLGASSDEPVLQNLTYPIDANARFEVVAGGRYELTVNFNVLFEVGRSYYYDISQSSLQPFIWEGLEIDSRFLFRSSPEVYPERIFHVGGTLNEDLLAGGTNTGSLLRLNFTVANNVPSDFDLNFNHPYATESIYTPIDGFQAVKMPAAVLSFRLASSDLEDL